MLSKLMGQLMSLCYIVYTVVKVAPTRRCMELSATWN